MRCIASIELTRWGWDRLDDAQFEILHKEAQESLRPFVAADGTVTLRAPAYLITATKACDRHLECFHPSLEQFLAGLSLIGFF